MRPLSSGGGIQSGRKFDIFPLKKKPLLNFSNNQIMNLFQMFRMIHGYRYTVLTESKLTPRKGQISISVEMGVLTGGGGSPIPIFRSNPRSQLTHFRQSHCQFLFSRIYRKKVICSFQGINLLLVSAVGKHDLSQPDQVISHVATSLEISL